MGQTNWTRREAKNNGLVITAEGYFVRHYLSLGHGYEHRHQAEKRDETIERWHRMISPRIRSVGIDVLLCRSVAEWGRRSVDGRRSIVDRRWECRRRWRRSSLASPRPWLMSVGTAYLSSLCSLLLCRAMWCWTAIWILSSVMLASSGCSTSRDRQRPRQREREKWRDQDHTDAWNESLSDDRRERRAEMSEWSPHRIEQNRSEETRRTCYIDQHDWTNERGKGSRVTRRSCRRRWITRPRTASATATTNTHDEKRASIDGSMDRRRHRVPSLLVSRSLLFCVWFRDSQLDWIHTDHVDARIQSLSLFNGMSIDPPL